MYILTMQHMRQTTSMRRHVILRLCAYWVRCKDSNDKMRDSEGNAKQYLFTGVIIRYY